VIAHVVETVPHGAADSIEAVMAQDRRPRRRRAYIAPDWPHELPANLAGVYRRLGSDHFHELGHYLVARWCGVKVLRFSVGMGKVVWSRRFGPTRPNGPFPPCRWAATSRCSTPREGVKACRKRIAREFTPERLARIAIVAAGPLANFLLAIVLCRPVMHGVEEPSSKLGPVAEQTAAYPAGLRSGCPSVNGKAVASWSELRWELIQATLDKQTARIDVRRPDRGMQEAILPTAGLTEADRKATCWASWA
jgi:regulator of sigma E protease